MKSNPTFEEKLQIKEFTEVTKDNFQDWIDEVQNFKNHILKEITNETITEDHCIKFDKDLNIIPNNTNRKANDLIKLGEMSPQSVI